MIRPLFIQSMLEKGLKTPIVIQVEGNKNRLVCLSFFKPIITDLGGELVFVESPGY